MAVREFTREFEGFAAALGVRNGKDGADYVFPDFALRVTPVTLEQAGNMGFILHLIDAEVGTEHRILLYEDRWLGDESGALKKRLAACLGKFRSVFARKCAVSRTDILTANAFLDKCHSYGAASAKYKYSLTFDGELVAVATFSGKKRLPSMDHSYPGTKISCEWIRYASLPDVRVSGGMGKMLKAFMKDVDPEEVLSYSDNEWSKGEVYGKLGFTRMFRTPPQEYYVNKKTYGRISAIKVGRDNLYKGREFPSSDYWRIYNAGSTRWFLEKT
ncbi:MAG: hypothetical protein LKK08_03870 [Bacteroidales bacterium]|nr:hypothetical protein [Bacteroidales bacterium]MCI2145369.1 hypothetical protein [Bacteroidales bacterium]